jgi:hypothetical protein
MGTDGGVIERAMKMIKVISPLPGEDLPTKLAEEVNQQVGKHEEDEAEEEPETETEEE